jgi:hypothetical protein
MPREDISQNAKEESTLKNISEGIRHEILTTDHNYEPHIRCTKIKPPSRDLREARKLLSIKKKKIAMMVVDLVITPKGMESRRTLKVQNFDKLCTKVCIHW